MVVTPSHLPTGDCKAICERGTSWCRRAILTALMNSERHLEAKCLGASGETLCHDRPLVRADGDLDAH